MIRISIKPIRKKLKTFFRKTTSRFKTHKLLIIVLTVLLIVGGGGIGVRNYFISKIKIAQQNNSNTSFSNYSPLPNSPEPSTSPSPSDTPAPPDNRYVLGASTYSAPSVPTPSPSSLPTPVYNPTPAPIYTPAPSSAPQVTAPAPAHSCASMGISPGVPTAWYSETSSPQTVTNTATINIQLLDCNNNTAPVSVSLTITQFSGPSTTVNGYSPPMAIETINGQASFTVKSQTSGTAVYVVRTPSFTVTDPNNHNPQVTFTITAPSPTPSPTSSPTPTSTPTSTPTPSASPTSSPSPSNTPTPTPTTNP